jgi:hypothetical protein
MFPLMVGGMEAKEPRASARAFFWLVLAAIVVVAVIGWRATTHHACTAKPLVLGAPAQTCN